MKQIIFLVAWILIIATSCVEPISGFKKLPPGIWRGELILDETQFNPNSNDEEIQQLVTGLNDRKVPFNFKVSYQDTNMLITFFNGDEEIVVKHIKYGRDKKVARDTMQIHFDEFDSYLFAEFEDNALEGYFYKNGKPDSKTLFRAKYGESYRFTKLKKEPATDLTGTWQVSFGEESPSPAVGEFKQKNNHITGTFRTETGDFRFLEGTVQGNKAYMSTFDGAHVWLFTVKLIDADNLKGTFRSGKTYKTTWSAKRNPNASLRDPSKIIDVIDKKLKLDLPYSSGILSLEDKEFENKTKIITIMGTWCPNCKDEINYLKEVNKKFPQVEILGVAFERYDQKKSLQLINKYKKAMNISFKIAYGGKASKKVASEVFPQLSTIASFPTLIIVDKNNEIQYVHSGFNGPATSKYKSFKLEFEEKLNTILND